MEGTGITPVMDINHANNCDGYGFGGGMWFMWIIVIFALMGGWGFNRNNGNDAAAVFANGALTRNEVASGFDYQTLNNGIRGVQQGLCDGFYAMNTNALNLDKSVLQAGNSVEKTVMQGDNGLGMAIAQTGTQLGSGLAENRFAMQNGFCEVNRNIDAVRAEAYRNTCEVTNAIKEESDKTRAMFAAYEMQELRDRLADRDRDLQSAKFQLSQVAQTQQSVGKLQPFPQPAYITASPYTGASSVYGYCGANA